MSSHPSVANPVPMRLRAMPLGQPTLDVLELRSEKGLPKPLTSLIGREDDVATASRFLRDDGARLLSLTGPGGVGKTRLALRITEELTPVFPDGVIFVPLAAIKDPRLVLPAVTRELGLQDVVTNQPRDLLIDVLYRQRALLVLDNFEQVRAAAREIAALLFACADLAVIVTSRVPLRISGEQRYPVAPLALPESGATNGQRGKPGSGQLQYGNAVRESISRSAAVQLFVSRARASDPSFTLDRDNEEAVAEICRRLDGLPLAIELAAARIPLLSPAELRARLDRALPYLSDGPEDAPPRLRTMRQAIAWSYDILSPDEQAVFRRLAVFVGGFTLETVEAINTRLNIVSADSLFGVMSTLLDHSLMRRIAPAGEEPRFGLLETVREFALEELAAHGEEQEARDAHAAYFCELAERAEPELQDAAWEEWVDRLLIEMPNLRAALDYFRQRGDGERAVRLAGAIGLFWTLPSFLAEGRSWLDMAVDLPGAGNDPELLAKALNAIGVLAQWQSDIPRIETVLTRALAIRQDLGDELGAAEVLGNLGNAALDSGQLDRAEALLTASLPVYERHARTIWVGETLTLLGHTVRARGDAKASLAYHTAAVDALRPLPGKNKLADALISLGWAAMLQGALDRARTSYREGLDIAEACDDRMRMGRSVGGAAGIAAAQDHNLTAARLFGAAAAQRDDEQVSLKPVIQTELDQITESVRERLGEDDFASAWTAGRALRLEDAVTEARAVLADSWRPSLATSSTSHSPGITADGVRLTPREWEVLRLLSSGRSDKQIAEELFISARTASSHVAAIMSKLGVTSRTAAVAIAVRDLLD